MHWHPNTDEWQCYLKGKARMTVFNTGPNALTMDFTAGDIGYVKRNYGHYVENVGDTDLQFIGVFRAPRYEEPTGSRIHRRNWWRSISRPTKRRSRNGQTTLQASCRKRRPERDENQIAKQSRSSRAPGSGCSTTLRKSSAISDFRQLSTGTMPKPAASDSSRARISLLGRRRHDSLESALNRN